MSDLTKNQIEYLEKKGINISNKLKYLAGMPIYFRKRWLDASAIKYLGWEKAVLKEEESE